MAEQRPWKPGTAKERIAGFCVWFTGLVFAMALIAALDVIDFHVCIKDAGHCKIIDPTKFDVVQK